MPLQITGIHKMNNEFENPYLAINSLMWIDDTTQNRGITTREVLFDWINDNGLAYIIDDDGLFERDRKAEEFLETGILLLSLD